MIALNCTTSQRPELDLQIGASYSPEMAKEMLNGSGVVIERATFRHCTADATLKMVQASHHCALAGVSGSANAEGALRLRVVAASDSAEHERQSRYRLDQPLSTERQHIIYGLIILVGRLCKLIS